MICRINRTTLLIFILLFSFLSGVYPFSAPRHNTDIGAILYGIDTWKDMQKHGQSNYNDLLSYYIVSDAVVFAVDYQAIGDNSSEKYESLKENIGKTSHPFSLPNKAEFITTGGGSHRAYNHQGFYFNYLANYEFMGISEEAAQKRQQRWELGRDKVLKPSVAAAFGLGFNDPRVELISVFAYYAHMIGDLAEGEQSSKEQMKELSTYSGLLSSFIKDINSAKSRCQQYPSNNIDLLIREAKILSKNITDYEDDSIAYYEVKSLLQRFTSQIIKDIGVSTEKIR
ncbi:hypothetical protein [uncultured Bacteroides sp.]|uniref:hypothetical protein n=1 Tax=uncultured Bacteroides sp. TaxID=162156 RepID=UPI0026251BD0|nr:hypothetical protein [uncultured Bacteroides sp.]